MFRPVLLVAVLVLASGCDSGPKLVEIEGTISVANKPMDQIYVEFLARGKWSSVDRHNQCRG